MQRWSVQVPPTLKAASTLIGFIKSGNGTVGKTQEERVKILRSAQDHLIGKTVQIRGDEQSGKGRVLYLLALTPEQVMEENRDRRMEGQHYSVGAFEAVVSWKESDGSHCGRFLKIGLLKVDSSSDPVKEVD
ncbi:MAG TPA: hypothetical protein VJB99_02105 [Patescibacteria group bacterium]|nr:hypothetical protein [Patescibacteria group bacterium]